jgi:zinc transporter, ZIP family
MLQALLYAAATGGALVIGAALGCFRTPPKQLTAGMLAFAAGALIVAVAFELFEPAHRQAGLARASAALLVGAATFIAADLLIERYASAEAAGLALVAAATLDGVPENLALGVGLAESASYALLASIVVSNLPEAFGGAARMRESGASSARVLSVWGVTAALLAVALVAGRFAADVASDESLGMLSALAAGAVLAALADSLMPQAYAEGGPLVAFATSGGFLAAYALTTLD